jgi:signal transduction histidine kinase/CheY-like chemotaxis protein
MLFLLLFGLLSGSQRVIVQGYLPGNFLSQPSPLLFTFSAAPSSPDGSSLHLIEWNLFTKEPAGTKQLCSFYARLPTNIQVLQNARFPDSDMAFISPDLPGAYSISDALFSHGITTVFFPTDTSFLIRAYDPEIPANFTAVDLPSSRFRFILVHKVPFLLFGVENSPIADLLCHVEPHYTFHFFGPFFIVCTIILLWFWLLWKPKLSRRSEGRFWIINGKNEICFGPPAETVDEFDWRSVLRCASSAFTRQQTFSTLIRLFRGDEYHLFQRAAAFPMKNGLVFAVLWREKFPEAADPQLDKNFESSFLGIHGGPALSFSTFRDFRPFHLAFTLDNYVRCVADLPASVVAPFQSYGETVTVLLAIFEGLVADANRGTFAELFTRCCKVLGLSCGFVFQNSERLIVQYTKEGLEPFTKERIMTIPESFPIEALGNLFVDNFVGDGDRYFLQRRKAVEYDLMVAIAVGEVANCTLREQVGLPFLGHCCVFVFHTKYMQEQAQKALQIGNLLTSSDNFSLIEVSVKTGRIISFKVHFLTGKQPTDWTEIQAALLAISSEFADLFDETRSATEVGGGTMPTRLIHRDAPTWFLVSAIVLHDPFFEDDLLFILIEEVPATPQRQLEQIGDDPLIRAMDSLHVHEFRISGTDIVLTNESLAIALSRSPTFQLRELFDEQDLPRWGELLSKGSATCRLISKSGPVWYSARCDRDRGFIFSINDLTETRNRPPPADDRFQLAASSSVLVFWTVDPSTGKVHSLFMQPTIWDILSVDSDAHFSHFADYLDPDDRDDFARGYAGLVSGDLPQWVREVRVLRMGGQYEWHRAVMAVSHTKILHCLLLNVHKQREMEAKLAETRKLRDLLMSSGKLALWRFTDDHEELPRLASFEPGLMTVVVMNWRFIDEQVHPDYRDPLRSQIVRAFENDHEPVGIDVPLLLDRETWVSVRGRLRPGSHQLVGVCIDVSELRATYTELETQKKRADEANHQKTIFLANMSHEIRTPMNGIFGILDLLALQELSTEQRLIVDTIRASSFQLMRLLDDTLNLSRIEQGELEASPSVFNLSKVIEPACVSAYGHSKQAGVRFVGRIEADVPELLLGDAALLGQVVSNLLSNATKFTKAGEITVHAKWHPDEVMVFEVIDTGIEMTADQQRVIFEHYTTADPSTARFFHGSGLGLALVEQIMGVMGGTITVESEVGQGSTFSCRFPLSSVMYTFVPPFSDHADHSVIVLATDPGVEAAIAEHVQTLRYSLKMVSNPEEVMAIAAVSKVDAIFVEGDKTWWEQLRQLITRIPGDPPRVCSICEPGEQAMFPTVIVKPILPAHIRAFMNGVRYRKEPPEVHAQDGQVGDQPRRILVVEDNKTNQFVMRKILQNIGCSFEIAENGQEAIETLERAKFDLIFMDCQMPVLDGLEATKIIRKCGKQYSSIPIVALTASAVEGDEQTCREAGMDGYLAKPVRIQQIKSAISRFNH